MYLRMPIGRYAGANLTDIPTTSLEGTRAWCVDQEEQRGYGNWTMLIESIDQELERRADDGDGT